MSEEVKDGDVSEETKEFDASAFGNGIVDSVENSTEESLEELVEDSTETVDTKESADDEDTSFDWSDNYSDDNSSESEATKKEEETPVVAESNEDNDTTQAEVSTDNNNTDTTEVDNTPVKFDGSLTDEHFSAFADELGINAKSMTELKDAMLELEADNKRLQESSGDNVTSKKITALQSYLKFDDQELLKKDLEA